VRLWPLAMAWWLLGVPFESIVSLENGDDLFVGCSAGFHVVIRVWTSRESRRERLFGGRLCGSPFDSICASERIDLGGFRDLTF
jgi:hypothetical protein